MNVVRRLLAAELAVLTIAADDMAAVHARALRVAAGEDAMELALPGDVLGRREGDELGTGVIVAAHPDVRIFTIALCIDLAVSSLRDRILDREILRPAYGHFVEERRGKLHVDRTAARLPARVRHPLPGAHRIPGWSAV